MPVWSMAVVVGWHHHGQVSPAERINAFWQLHDTHYNFSRKKFAMFYKCDTTEWSGVWLIVRARGSFIAVPVRLLAS